MRIEGAALLGQPLRLLGITTSIFHPQPNPLPSRERAGVRVSWVINTILVYPLLLPTTLMI